jgi:thiol-disulfide isomerase/thioredoxin
MRSKFNVLLIVTTLLLSYSTDAGTLQFKYEIAPVSVFSQSGRDSAVRLKDFTRPNLDSYKLFPWFKNAYRDYNPRIRSTDSLSLFKDHISIVVFGGSWCGDTKDLLPKFYKTVENAKIPPDRITLIGVDRHKHSRDGRSRKYRIKRVPTFILFYDGKEIGRIVESVNQSIEADMLNIYNKTGH